MLPSVLVILLAVLSGLDLLPLRNHLQVIDEVPESSELSFREV